MRIFSYICKQNNIINFEYDYWSAFVRENHPVRGNCDMKQIESKQNWQDTYRIETTGMNINMFMSLLIATITSIIPMLVNKSPAIYYTSLPFYITIVILFGCVMYYRWWGLVIGLFTFLLCGTVIILSVEAEQLSAKEMIRILAVNTFANMLQLILILFAFLMIKALKRKNKNRYTTGAFYLSKYNSLLLFVFFVYLAICLTTSDNGTWMSQNMTTILYVFFFITLGLTILKIIWEKDLHLLCYTTLIALIPSVIACFCSVFMSDISRTDVLAYITTWVLSNYILLQTCGYILFQVLYSRRAKFPKTDEQKLIDISSLCYYFAVLIWNIIIIYLFFSRKMGTTNNLIYLFPWMLGNVFLGANLAFSRFSDAGGVKDKFRWFEQRVIVVEQNTTGIITIISFLLPLGVNFLRNDIPDTILFLFIFDIFSACLSVGIIWIPANNVKFIALLKTLKTIFYLYSITFLLVSVIMIMQLLQKTDISNVPAG